MVKKILWIIPITVLIVLILVVVNNTQKKNVQIVQQPNDQVSGKTLAPQKTDNQAEVSVEVTPKELAAGSEVKFEVVLNTHSVVLDQDLAKVSQLQDDQGNIYQPSSWDGGSSGHHLSGTLSFPQISQNAKSVDLKISQIGGVERTFKWNL